MGFVYHRDPDGLVTVTMDMDGQSANTMSQTYHELMGETVSRLESESGLTGVVFASAKKTFFAGGDLHGLLARETADAAYLAWLEEDKGFLRRLERLPVPVVAAINGAALGGGFEICLAASHRLLLDVPGAVVGLPEVTLGLLPGAGGVVRLTSMIGIEAALPLLLDGTILSPAAALAAGLVDGLCRAADELVPQAKAWIRAHPEAARQPWDRPGFRCPARPGFDPAAFAAKARAELRQRTRDKAPAPARILETALSALDLPFDAALAEESRQFCALVGTPEARAAISTFFFSANAIRSGKLRPQGPREVPRGVVVAGTGAAGCGLAGASARSGIATRLLDADRDRADAAVRTLLDLAGERPRARMATTLSAVTGLAGPPPDLVIDTAAEDTATARTRLLRAFPHLAAGGIYLLHTSALAIGPVAAASPDPSRVAGLHVPGPADGPGIAEIIAGPATSADCLRRAYDFVQQIGRTPVIVTDTPGFFVPRLRAACLAEARSLLDEGLAADAIEEAAWQAGLTGGPLLAALPAEVAPASPPARPISADEAEDRLLFIQAIEALRCLAGGVVRSEAEANLGSILGAGFPRHTGGALQFIHGLGIETFAARARGLADLAGARFLPDAGALARLAPRAAA